MLEAAHVPEQIAENIAALETRISRACEAAGRLPTDVRLVAVTKTVPVSDIKAAAACGVTDFGENRVQEALVKVPELPGIGTWHLIGSLQTNKVRAAAELFSYIHSVDRPRLVAMLARTVSQPFPVYLQVNVAREESKHGVEVDEAPEMARLISAAGLRLVGLMTIAPFVRDPEDVRPVFRRLNRLRSELQDLALPGASLEHLSMGMSNDFEVAIEEGADVIRVGSAIFGSRRG